MRAATSGLSDTKEAGDFPPQQNEIQRSYHHEYYLRSRVPISSVRGDRAGTFALHNIETRCHIFKTFEARRLEAERLDTMHVIRGEPDEAPNRPFAKRCPPFSSEVEVIWKYRTKPIGGLIQCTSNRASPADIANSVCERVAHTIYVDVSGTHHQVITIAFTAML